MKKFVSVLLAGVLTAGLLAGCQKSDVKTIGVIQFATHPSLDNCYNGFVEGLKQEGFEDGKNIRLEFQNAQGEPTNADLAAKNMVTKKVDMILGIATPAAVSAYSAAKDTDIPVVFNAVSDPVSAQLVQSIEAPGNNCTGTSDVLPIEAMLKMIKAFLPDAEKVGILYTTSEQNSISQLAAYTEAARAYDLEVVPVGVTNASEVAAAAQTMVSKGVDCLQNFTDNNVVDNLSTVLNATNEAGIPVFGSEVEQVKNGCAACEGIDYYELGIKTGKLTAEILKGGKASETPVVQVSDSTPAYNPEVMEALGITLPADYADAEAVSAE